MRNSSSLEIATIRLKVGRQKMSRLVENKITKIPNKQTKNNMAFDLIDLNLAYWLPDSIYKHIDPSGGKLSKS